MVFRSSENPGRKEGRRGDERACYLARLFINSTHTGASSGRLTTHRDVSFPVRYQYRPRSGGIRSFASAKAFEATFNHSSSRIGNTVLTRTPVASKNRTWSSTVCSGGSPLKRNPVRSSAASEKRSSIESPSSGCSNHVE